MGIVDDILADLGLGGATLEHIQAASATVIPDGMDAMADVFEMGSTISGEGSSKLNTAINQVVTGWKGKAADAASTKVLTTSRTSDELGSTSTTVAGNTREYASAVRGLQSKIAAVEPVDTSAGAAVKAAGGPAAVILNPASVGQQMLAAQVKAEQHREQAAGYLSQMNSHSTDYVGQPTYPAAKSSTVDGSLPASLSVEPIRSGGGSGSRETVRPVTTGSSGTGSTGHGGGNGGATLSTFKDPSGKGTGTVGTKPTRPGTGTPVRTPPATLVDTTSTANANLPSTAGAGSPPPSAVSSGAVESGISPGLLGGLAAGGGALAAAGGLAGGRGAALAGGRGSFAGERGGPLSGRGAAGGESFERTGRGAVAEGTGRPGMGATEPALRPSALSSAASSEAAAGNRGFLPGGGAARGSGDDDAELNRRPDYLVETDDLWGDGRLAAPPVLG